MNHSRSRWLWMGMLLPGWLLMVSATDVAAPRTTGLTIYTRDLAFARESRSLDLRSGRDTVRLGGLPDRIDVSSIRLALPGRGRVTRLAYRFDVASGDRVLEVARGRRVAITTRNSRVVEGTLEGSDGAWILVREDSGALVTVSRAEVADVRIARPPDRLAIEPTLEAIVEGGSGGMTPAELSYLTGGLSWSAEHTILKTGESAALWSTMVSIENTSGRDYDVPRLGLVAGEPNRVTPPPMPMMEAAQMRLKTTVADGAAAAPFAEEGFADYHLYTLDHRTLLRDRETQRLPLLDERTVRMTPRYLYRQSSNGVTSQLRLVNVARDGLGQPLPAGRVRVYERDARGELRFTGEAQIGHTAEGETLTVDVGRAFDLVAERRQVYDRRISDREREYEVEIRFRNHKNVPVTIEAEESVPTDQQVLKSNRPYTRKDASTLQFTVPVPAGKEEVLDYVVRVRW